MVPSFIRQVYDGKGPFIYSDEHIQEVWSDMELFGLGPQLHQALAEMNRLHELPSYIQERLSAKVKQALYHNLFMKHKEEETLRALDSHGLDAIPLKGVRFAERYYGHFAARVTSDIDLFVPEEQLDSAIDICQGLGYEFEIVKDHHARLHRGGLMIELHWTLDKMHWSDLRAAPFWKQAVRLEGFRSARELSPLHTFYFICLHGARHQMDSVRYILDVAQVIRAAGSEIDYHELFEQTAEDKTTKRVQAVMSIAYDLLPGLHEIKPLPFKTLDTHWSYPVIRSARLGTKTSQYYLYKLYFRHLLFDTVRHQMKSLTRAY
jgi:hypothetical protein